MAIKKDKKKVVPQQPELSSDEFDSDMEIYEDSEDGIYYEDEIGGLFAEDIDMFEDAEDEDESIEFEDGEYEMIEESEDEDIDLEEVPELIPASDAENDGVSVVKTVKAIDKNASKNKFEFLTQGRVAIKALIDGYQKKNEKKDEKKQLFPESNNLFLHVTYKLPLDPRVEMTGNRRYFEYPFSDKSPLNASVCLILPDLSHTKTDKRDPEVDKQSKLWLDILREKFGVTQRDVSAVFTLNQLKREYTTQEAKRKFTQTYDILLVDRTILRPVIYHLEKWAQKRGKMPIPFNVTKKDIPEQIKRAYRVGQYDLRPASYDVNIKLGNLTQSTMHIQANFAAATDCLFKHIPGGEQNVRMADIRTDSATICLPVYVDFDSKHNVKMPMDMQSKADSYIEDLDTLPIGFKIKFDGIDFTVVDEEGNEVPYPFDEDEIDPTDDLPVPSKVDYVREKAKELMEQNKLKRIAEVKKEKIIVRRLKNLKKRQKDKKGKELKPKKLIVKKEEEKLSNQKKDTPKKSPAQQKEERFSIQTEKKKDTPKKSPGKKIEQEKLSNQTGNIKSPAKNLQNEKDTKNGSTPAKKKETPKKNITPNKSPASAKKKEEEKSKSSKTPQRTTTNLKRKDEKKKGVSSSKKVRFSIG